MAHRPTKTRSEPQLTKTHSSTAFFDVHCFGGNHSAGRRAATFHYQPLGMKPLGGSATYSQSERRETDRVNTSGKGYSVNTPIEKKKKNALKVATAIAMSLALCVRTESRYNFREAPKAFPEM